MANPSDIFRFVNFGVGGVMVLGGISQFFPMSFQSIVIGCYVILFGLGMHILPPAVVSVERTTRALTIYGLI